MCGATTISQAFEVAATPRTDVVITVLGGE